MLLLALVLPAWGAELAPAVPTDDRFPLDLLLVVAHPDDEVFAGAYLARAVLDEGRRVGVVYATRGEAGENAVGAAQGAALAAIREAEAHAAWASWGVPWVWFVGASDSASQNVLRSLENWRSVPALEQLVRLIRLTRPRVVLTFFPGTLVGENHADHQATGVLATEAFDMAGDPAAFAHQCTPARRLPYSFPTVEGLAPWQPQKLYCFTDAADRTVFAGRGPEYAATAISPSRKIPYVQLLAKELTHHRSQEFPGQLAARCLKKADFSELAWPVRLLAAKSHVGGTASDDVFAGTTADAIRFQPPVRPAPPAARGVWLELGGPWAFYSRFRAAHNLEQLDKIREPEAGMGADRLYPVPLVLHNDTRAAAKVRLEVTVPEGWSVPEGGGDATLPAGTVLTQIVRIAAPAGKTGETKTTGYRLVVGGSPVASVKLRIQLQAGGLPLN